MYTERYEKQHDALVVSLQALSLPPQYKAGRLLACQLLCKCILRRHDLDIDEALLSRFYLSLHAGLVHADQVCSRQPATFVTNACV